MFVPADRSYITVRARVALTVAQQHAQQWGEANLGTDHLLLALPDPPGDPLQTERTRLGSPTTEAAAAIAASRPHTLSRGPSPPPLAPQAAATSIAPGPSL